MTFGQPLNTTVSNLPPCWYCTNNLSPRGMYPEPEISADGKRIVAVHVKCPECNGSGFASPLQP